MPEPPCGKKRKNSAPTKFCGYQSFEIDLASKPFVTLRVLGGSRFCSFSIVRFDEAVSELALTISPRSARILKAVRNGQSVVSPNSGPVAQLGARFHGMEEVVGSIPTRSTNSLPIAALSARSPLWRYSGKESQSDKPFPIDRTAEGLLFPPVPSNCDSCCERSVSED